MYESSGAGTTVYLCKEKRTGTIRVVKKYRDDLLSIPQQKMVSATASSLGRLCPLFVCLVMRTLAGAWPRCRRLRFCGCPWA